MTTLESVGSCLWESHDCLPVLSTLASAVALLLHGKGRTAKCALVSVGLGHIGCCQCGSSLLEDWLV